MGFATTLALNGVEFEFHFDHIKTANGMKFFVFAKDQVGNSWSFDMEKDGESWRIVNAPKVPETIIENEQVLSDLIKKEAES